MNAVEAQQNIDIQRFSAWLESNERFKAPYSEKTKRVYLSVIAALFAFRAKEDLRSFEEFNLPWLRRFISRDPETGGAYSQSYQILRTSALRVFWFWMVETKAVTVNLIDQLLEEKRRDSKQPSGGKPPKRLPDVLDWDEQRDLLSAVQRSGSRTSSRDYALITLVLASGLRCEEVCNVQCDNVAIEYKRLRIIGKGNKERVVDFGHDLLAVDALMAWLVERDELLGALGEQTDTLFVSVNGKPMTESLVYQQVSKYLKLAGLNGRARHRGSHLLRHTATSIMFARQVPLLQIQANLGHEQLTTTQIYAHLLPSEHQRYSAAV